MEESKEEFFLKITYKGKTVEFRVVNPELDLGQLIHNVRHATGGDGKLIFDFPSLDYTGAPLDYFFAKEDGKTHELRILRPRIGNCNQKLSDYNVRSNDTLHVIPDPFPG